jgi:hypothetical protein
LVWPWYSVAAPFHWLITADVYAAREHMNLSWWGFYNEEERTRSLIGVCEMVGANKMPSWYYKAVHYPAVQLSDDEKRTYAIGPKRKSSARPPHAKPKFRKKRR